MKGCASVLFLCAALGAGGYYVAQHPTLVSQATQDAQRATTWVQSHLPTPTAATQAPAVINLGTVGPAVTTTPPTAAPAPAAPSTTVVTWSASDCNWAVNTLAWDQSLDSQEAQKIASGQDTRWGNTPDVIAYYQNYAREWSIVLGEVRSQCSMPGPFVAMTAAQASQAVGWFDTATAAHRSDLSQHVSATWSNSAGDWDLQWIASYQRLDGLMHTLGG